MRYHLPTNDMQAISGKEFSIETLSRYCFATTEGVSHLGISEAANKLGLHSICGRVSMEQMQEAPLPCILHWNQNHFLIYAVC